MKNALPTIDTLTECPNCGYDEYYAKDWVAGSQEYATRFDGKQAYNGEMWQGISTVRHGKIAYCSECRKPIARIETN